MYASPPHCNGSPYLTIASPNAAVDACLVYKKHDGAVGYHTDEMRAQAAVKPAKALLPNDGLCAVNEAAIMSAGQIRNVNGKRVQGVNSRTANCAAPLGASVILHVGM